MGRFHLIHGIASCRRADDADDVGEEEEDVEAESEEDWEDTEKDSSGCPWAQLPLMATMAAALRKFLSVCGSSEALADVQVLAAPCPSCSPAMEIGRPADVQHITDVTFDRFDDFPGPPPADLLPDVPRRSRERTVATFSSSVFGVSPESMQCSCDQRGKALPTILLALQRHLYLQGGLQEEGIFRINAEHSQELLIKDQLNRGLGPNEIDSHCLAGLIKAWFRELPNKVLDSLTLDQMSSCNTEEECSELARMLPPTEAALLGWCVDLMADVVEHEHCNKMNARNIAMVFAPNMTEMADPLTALVHAVKVMNFLQMLITKTLREREETNDKEHIVGANDKESNLQALDKILPEKFAFDVGKPQKSDLGEGNLQPSQQE